MSRPFLVASLAAALPLTAAAQTSFPMITHCTPAAVQRGTTAEVEVACQMDFRGAYKVLFADPRVTAAVLPAPEPKAKDGKTPPAVRTVKLKVTAAPDAPAGVIDFRVATRLGVSSLGQLLICDEPVVVERPGVNTSEKAQPAPVPCVVAGRIEAAENVDWYAVPAKAGTFLTLEVTAARMEDKIHDLQKHLDPLVTVTDASGRELAAADDGAFADPVLGFRVPADGVYRVQVRDAKYDGDPRWAYTVRITDRPVVRHLFPLGLTRGEVVSAEPVLSDPAAHPTWPVVGPQPLGIRTIRYKLPDADAWAALGVVVTDHPTAREQEPNDTPKQATPLPVPGGVNGRIQARRDLDHFRFTGAKGKAVRLEVFARRFGTPLVSPLDAALDVLGPDGKVLAGNDDAIGKDPVVTFTPPADGGYVARVRDLNNKGGPGFVYYLEATPARSDFTLKVDPCRAMIGPGSRTAWFVQVARTDGFAGPVKVAVEGLPAGVSVNPLTIPPGMTQGCLVLTADRDAKVDAAVVKVLGTATAADEHGKPVALTREATTVEEIYLPGGGRGRFDAGLQAVAVTDPSDLLDVSVSKTEVVLKPGEEVTLDVTVKRRADYDKPVTLDVFLRHLGGVHGNPLPPGVTLVEGKSKTLLGTGTAGKIVLKAAADAPACDRVPVCVQGFVAVNFVVKLGYSSPPVWVTVRK
ncbi:MAG: PPC domain-containing protein [Gemmataceae bacterium]